MQKKKIVSSEPISNIQTGRVESMKLTLACGHIKYMRVRRQIPTVQTNCMECARK